MENKYKTTYTITILNPMGQQRGHHMSVSYWKQTGKAIKYKTELPARKRFEKLKDTLEKGQQISLMKEVKFPSSSMIVLDYTKE